MAKVVLDKREADIWRKGTSVPAFIHICSEKDDSLSYYQQWRDELAATLHTLSGHLGGYGIDFVDEDGNDLSDPLDEEKQFSYMSPENTYTAVLGTELITIDSYKDS